MEYFVIGAGSIGTRHAENLRTLGATPRHLGWRGLSLSALESDMRACGPGGAAMVIATATDIRLPLVEIAARLGAAIYLEKPAAVTPGDLDALFRAAAGIADRSVIGFMMRYHPVVADLAARDLGDIYGFGFEIGHDVHQWRANWSFADSYAARAGAGGVLLDLCHELDMAALLFPGLTLGSVDCRGDAEFPTIDFATRIALTAPGGRMGTVAMDYLAPRGIRRIRLRGIRQMADIDLLGLTETDPTTGKSIDLAPGFDRNDMFLGLMRDFMALAEGRSPASPLVPRMDRMYDTCALISRAWAARSFSQPIETEAGP